MSFNEQLVEQDFLVTPLQECRPNFMTPRGRVRRLQPLRIPLIASNSNLHQCPLHRAPRSLCPPNLPWSEFPQLLHPGYCDTKILFLLYPQTPFPRSLSLRNSTLGHFAPKFSSPVLKATGPASQVLTPPPQGVSLFPFPPPQSSPHLLGWKQLGRGAETAPASAAANQRLPHAPPTPKPPTAAANPQQRCSSTSTPGGLTPNWAPLPTSGNRVSLLPARESTPLSFLLPPP